MRRSTITTANLFAIAGFFIHPLLHFWVRSSPALEAATHGYIGLSTRAENVVVARFVAVWTAEIATLWLVGAAMAWLIGRLVRARARTDRG